MNGNYLLTWLYCCARLAGSGGTGRKVETSGRMDSGHALLFDIKNESRKQKAESGNLGNEAAGFRLRQGYGGQAGL